MTDTDTKNPDAERQSALADLKACLITEQTPDRRQPIEYYDKYKCQMFVDEHFETLVEALASSQPSVSGGMGKAYWPKAKPPEQGQSAGVTALLDLNAEQGQIIAALRAEIKQLKQDYIDVQREH